MPKKKGKKRKAKALTKKQLVEVAKEVDARRKISEVKASVSKQVLAERHVDRNKVRKAIFTDVCTDEFLSSLCNKFMTLFTENSSGPFDNKYAKLQLQWVQYLSGILKDYVTTDYTMPDVSAVIHAIGTAVFDFMATLINWLYFYGPGRVRG